MFVGVDGYKKGWVVVVITATGFSEARVFRSFEELMAHYTAATTIAVDMPIGLVGEGDREADRAARRLLKGQASSVFNAPPTPVLAAKDYGDAQEISRCISGKGITQQAFAIFPKIIEVREFVRDPRIHEVHPEVSFRLLNEERQLGKKKSWGGLHSRLQLLRSVGIELPDDLGEANGVGTDDVVDAAAAAWSARRISEGRARSFPETPGQTDSCGRQAVIWA